MHASPFFDGIEQTQVRLGDEVMDVPVFYEDGAAVTGVFPARLRGLRDLLPDRRLVPARLAPGVGAVTITCFEYRASGIGPYNELAIAVPLNEPFHRPNLPGRAMASAVRRNQYDVWVQHLPVTTELARAGGVEFYNYPKFLADIDFEDDDGGRRRCRLAEGGEHILTMTTDRLRSSGPRTVQLFSHLYHERQPQSAEFRIQAPASGQSLRRGAARLELGGRHAIAQELRGLLLSTASIAAVSMPGMQGILYGPDHLNPALMAKLGVLSPPSPAPAGQA